VYLCCRLGQDGMIMNSKSGKDPCFVGTCRHGMARPRVAYKKKVSSHPG
jgi:hypothetical protein